MKLKSIYIPILILTALLLSACGGGGSSSSGSGGASATGDYVGTYTGQQKVRVTVFTIVEEVQGPITIIIAADGSVTFQEEGVTTWVGSLNGNQFKIPFSASALNEPGFSCSGTIDYMGTVTGKGISGDISSSGFECNSIPASASGSFSAKMAG